MLVPSQAASMVFEHLFCSEILHISTRAPHCFHGVKKKRGDTSEFPFTLKNCVLTRLDFSKNSFRIKDNTYNWSTMLGTGRELRGSVHGLNGESGLARECANRHTAPRPKGCGHKKNFNIFLDFFYIFPGFFV